MDQDRKKSLIELGPEALADALLESAVQFDAVDDLIEHLIATPMENMKRSKSKLAGLKRRRRISRNPLVITLASWDGFQEMNAGS